MEKDTRIVEKLQVYELQEIIKNVPKLYFKAAVKEACMQLNTDCKRGWTKDMHEFAEKVTGLNTTTPEAKDHMRGVYKYAEGQQEKSKLVGVTVIKEGVKVLVIAFLVYIGLRLS